MLIESYRPLGDTCFTRIPFRNPRELRTRGTDVPSFFFRNYRSTRLRFCVPLRSAVSTRIRPTIHQHPLRVARVTRRKGYETRLGACSTDTGMRRGTVAFSSQPDLEPDGARRSLADIYKLHRRRETEGPNRLGVFQRLFSLFGSRPASRKTSTASFTGAGENIPFAN